MRNLKRVLSLALALVMVLGMMVITTSAADYADKDEITEIEAVEVLSAIGMVQGDGTGFNPNGNFTREAAAKLLTYMLIGPDMAEKLAGTDVFDDVAADRWSAKYIGYCANLGYITGVGDGKFNPEGILKDIELGKLVLCALGYDAAEYTGDNWASAVTVDMLEAKLVNNVTGEAITREDACAMILTAMKKIPATSKGWYYEGTENTLGYFDSYTDVYLAAKEIIGNTFDANKITKDTSGSLLKSVYGWNFDDTAVYDDFGRPAVSYDNGKTGAKKVELLFVDEADETYVVTGRQDTDLDKIADKLELEVAATATSNVTTAVKGDTVELFLDKDGKIAAAVKLHTELAQVNRVVEPAEEDAKYSYSVTLDTETGKVVYKDTALEGFDAATMVKDTYVTLTKDATGETAIVAIAEYVTGKQTATGAGYIKVDGVQKYFAGNEWDIDTLDFTSTFNFYLDANGLVIGYEKVAAAKADVKVFYVDDTNFVAGGDFAEQKAQLAVINLDGTKEIVNMAVTKADATDDGNVTAKVDCIKVGGSYVKLVDGYSLAEDIFYAYTVNADGEITNVTAVTTDGIDTNGDSRADTAYATAIDFEAKGAIVDINDTATTKYADANTTVTVINTITGKATTITGYANFDGTDYDPTQAVYTYAGSTLKEVYILSDTVMSVASDITYGWYVETGDTYVLADGTVVTDVVYSVNGVDTTYTIVGTSVVEDLVSIVVTNGIAAVTDYSTANSAKENVVLGTVYSDYVLIGGTPTYFNNGVKFYDVTNVAKNGVVEIDEITEGSIVSYTAVSGGANNGKIIAVYVTCEAKEDGTISLSKNNAADVAYFETLGLNPAALSGIADTTSYAVVQYTRPANSTSKTFEFKFWNVETPASITTWNLNEGYTNPAIGEGVLLTSASGSTNTYNYQIVFDGTVIQTGSFTLAK